jgi:hypothetical protein
VRASNFVAERAAAGGRRANAHAALNQSWRP